MMAFEAMTQGETSSHGRTRLWQVVLRRPAGSLARSARPAPRLPGHRARPHAGAPSPPWGRSRLLPCSPPCPRANGKRGVSPDCHLARQLQIGDIRPLPLRELLTSQIRPPSLKDMATGCPRAPERGLRAPGLAGETAPNRGDSFPSLEPDFLVCWLM